MIGIMWVARGGPARLAALLLLKVVMVLALAMLPSGAAVRAEDEGPLSKRLLVLTRPDGSVDAPYSSGTPEEQAVEAAVERFWILTTDALTTADDSRLSEVMGGVMLARSQDLYRRLQHYGEVVESEIQPIAPMAFVELVPERAIVYVEIRSWGIYRDAETGREKGSWPSQIIRQYYLLEPIDGVWKVTDDATKAD